MGNYVTGTPVFTVADNIISSIGYSTDENTGNICREKTGIRMTEKQFSPDTYPFSLVDPGEPDENSENPDQFTRLEKMLIASVQDALQNTSIDITDGRCVIVISTTKGNIDLLKDPSPVHVQAMLWNLGKKIGRYFGNPNKPVVISSACISGVLAVETASRMIRSGMYDHAVITGGDMVSDFVVSGFASFKALSNEACRPYDIKRNGLTLGEGAATLVISNKGTIPRNPVFISGGASSNDGVHISAPDRTGTGLFQAISKAVGYAGLDFQDIDAICAHGTATAYNDEMESQAFYLAGLQDKPVYSLKGYWGHTLGASGLMEIVAGIHSLKKQVLFKTLGFESSGLTKPLNVTTSTRNIHLRHMLKTASGFGGCNAAIVLSV